MSSLSEPRRPRLLASNRKLRHLRGISLRELSFAPSSLYTSDDAALPSRLQALSETGLHASRSSDNLRLHSETKRPKGVRRTSLSLNPTHTTPAVRQRRLEGLRDGAVGEVFFSLHTGGEDPVYVSEVRDRSTVRLPTLHDELR